MSHPRRRDCLKHFYLYPDGRPTTRRWGIGGKDEVFRSFSGWLADIITAGLSLLVFSFPFPLFYSAKFCVSESFPSFGSRFSPLPPSYFVSRHCPFQSPRDCGANTARYRINFLSRGCRDFTLLERRHWGGRSGAVRNFRAAARLSGVSTSASVSGTYRGDESEIKPRGKLKRGTEGS